MDILTHYLLQHEEGATDLKYPSLTHLDLDQIRQDNGCPKLIGALSDSDLKRKRLLKRRKRADNYTEATDDASTVSAVNEEKLFSITSTGKEGD